MADTSASTMPPDRQIPVAIQSETAEDTSASASSSDRWTTAGSEEQTKEEANVVSSQSTPESDRTRQRKQNAYVESVDISDEDNDGTSVSDYFPYSASAIPVSTPKIPWRKGGIWHVRSGTQRDGPKWTGPPGSGGRTRYFPDHTDSDTDSNVSVEEFHVQEFPPNVHGEEFDDTDSDGMGAWREFLHIDLDSDSERERPHGPPEEPLYPQGLLVETECYVCFEETELRRRLCCDFPVCDRCLESYLMVQVLQANVKIECLNINCNSYIHRNEISARLPARYKLKFYKFLIDANVDPTVKTCPRCSSGLQVDKGALKKRKVVKNGLPVTCKRCGLDWCFTCHAPLHKGLSCKEFRKGDVLLKDWAREFHYGQLNAQQCPKCKIFIQRSLGCDHMICTRCSTNFCYRCGENYRGIKLLGNHFSRYSPFGCRYNLMPDAPHMRRLIRGTVLGGKILGGLVLSGFVVAAGACLLGVGVIALPAWGGYKLHKRRRFKQRLRANRKYNKQALALRNLEARGPNHTRTMGLPLFAIPEVLESSDSMADDSSDEMRDRIMVDLELPDSQRVEVLVHQTISSSSDQEEGGGASGGGGETREVVTDSTVIVTDVQEVTNGDGYTTVLTNVHAKPKVAAAACVPASAAANSSDEADDENFSDDEHSRIHASQKSKRHSPSAKRNTTSGKENRRNGGKENKTAEDRDGGGGDEKDKLSSSVAKVAECEHDDQRSSQTKQHKTHKKETDSAQGKRLEEKEANVGKEKKDKPGEENSEKSDKKPTDPEPCTEKEKLLDSSEKNEKKADKDSSCPCKPGDQKDGDELSKESTNGCFGNIFSKKIAVIQIGSKRNTETQPDAQKPTNACYKSSTWEKSRAKSSQHKHKTSMDIQDLSHFKEKLPLQSSDLYGKPAYDKGLLLQDFVVLSPPGDFGFGERVKAKSGDSLSLASASSVEDAGSGKEAEKGGEGSSCCCLSASDSFRGSNLSCDIVTYL